MIEVHAKKRLGQHFLTDEDVAKAIAETLPMDNDLPVLEIGPGMGVLTKYLKLIHGERLTAVEVDHESVEFLMREMSDVRVVEGDFLKLNLEKLFPGGGDRVGDELWRPERGGDVGPWIRSSGRAWRSC